MAAPNNTHSVYIHSSDDIAKLAATMDQVGEGFRLPLLRAVREGAIATVFASNGERIARRFLSISRPNVVVLCDDHPAATGVDNWPQARRLMRWASVAILHATGGAHEHYHAAVGCAVMRRRVLLVEMEHRHHAGWLALAKKEMPRLRAISLVPPAGDQHPDYQATAGQVMQ